MLFALVLTVWLLIAGDVLLDAAGIPVPGPAAGMLGLVVLYVHFTRLREPVGRLFDAIIPIAPLFFVPAAVGVVANIDLIASEWIGIVFAITLGTAATLVVTGLLMQRLLRLPAVGMEAPR